MARMHADEVETGIRLVRRLVAAQFPAWAGLPLTPVLPLGTDNALYRLGEDMVVRLPRHEPPTAALAKERHWLPLLAPHLPLSVPVPLADGVPAAGYPFAWCVYRWLPGENAAVAPIAGLGRLGLDLARFIAALQAIDPAGGPGPGPHNSFRGEPLGRRDAETRAAIGSLGPRIDAAAATAVWEDALRAAAWMRAPVWIHGDLDARNVLVQDGRLSAVLDFGCLGVGDPACDAMVAWKVLDAPARAAFRSALALDEATWARSRGWALTQAVAALAYYTEESNPTLVRQARQWLDAVLAAWRR